jgi:very-short-patch-repair endonuclease
LEEDVAGEIRRMGYNVIPQVGCSGYRIDIGVIDPANPGHFILGVECDGATYHSSYSARDRDRLREQVLRKLGWKIHRVWAPTWATRRESEVRRLKEALEQARGLQAENAISEEDTDPAEMKESQPQEVDVKKVQFAGIEKIGVPYKLCELKAQFSPYVRVRISRYPYSSIRKNEFHFQCNRELQSHLLAQLVRNEGPVHFDYAAQRLAAAWGIKRAGHKVVNATKQAVNLCLRNGSVTLKEHFLWPVGLRDVPIRVPIEGISDSMRKPEYIPPEEIEGAMRLVARYALGISAESLIVETARVFGFNRTGEKVRERFLEVYKESLKKRTLVCKNDIVTSTQA